jgi:hypothetical protein
VSSAASQLRQRKVGTKEAERHEHNEQRANDPGRRGERQVEPAAPDTDQKTEKEADERGDHDRISFGSPDGPPHRGFDFASRCAAKRSVTT